MSPKQDPRVIVALDFPVASKAWDLVHLLEPGLCRLKVGKELFTRAGPAFVEQLAGLGYDVFLDLKFHDIPNTVAGACAAAADLGVWMINVHAAGGRRMMEAALERLDMRTQRPLLVAVTVLTSLSQKDIEEIGFQGSPAENVIRLARLADQAGLDGVVCSPREAALVRPEVSEDFSLVTPGVRPKEASKDDQRRVMTPADAIRNGADYLVVGRPVTAANEPLQALNSIRSAIETAMSG